MTVHLEFIQSSSSKLSSRINSQNLECAEDRHTTIIQSDKKDRDEENDFVKNSTECVGTEGICQIAS